MVLSSLRVGSPRLMVCPARSLSSTSKARSANSSLWKVFSANHLSTRMDVISGVTSPAVVTGLRVSSSLVCSCALFTTRRVPVVRRATAATTWPNGSPGPDGEPAPMISAS